MKGGLSTTEFWLTLLVTALAVAGVVLERVSAEWGATAAAVVSGLYVIGRTALKLRGLSVDVVEEARHERD